MEIMPLLDDPARAAAVTLPAIPPDRLELVLIVTCGKRIEPPEVEVVALDSVVRLPEVEKLYPAAINREPPFLLLEERLICTPCPCSDGTMSPEATIARFCPAKVRFVGSTTLPELLEIVPAPPVGLNTSGVPFSVPLP